MKRMILIEEPSDFDVKVWHQHRADLVELIESGIVDGSVLEAVDKTIKMLEAPQDLQLQAKLKDRLADQRSK